MFWSRRKRLQEEVLALWYLAGSRIHREYVEDVGEHVAMTGDHPLVSLDSDSAATVYAIVTADRASAIYVREAQGLTVDKAWLATSAIGGAYFSFCNPLRVPEGATEKLVEILFLRQVIAAAAVMYVRFVDSTAVNECADAVEEIHDMLTRHTSSW